MSEETQIRTWLESEQGEQWSRQHHVPVFALAFVQLKDDISNDPKFIPIWGVSRPKGVNR